MSPSAESVIFWLYLAHVVVILVPFVAYNSNQFYLIRNSDFVRRRFPFLIIISSIFGSIACIIIAPFTQFTIAYVNSSKILNIYLFIYRIIYPLIVQGSFYSILCRFWMIYYEFQFSYALSKSKWTHYINQNVCYISSLFFQ